MVFMLLATLPGTGGMQARRFETEDEAVDAAFEFNDTNYLDRAVEPPVHNPNILRLCGLGLGEDAGSWDRAFVFENEGFTGPAQRWFSITLEAANEDTEEDSDVQYLMTVHRSEAEALAELRKRMTTKGIAFDQNRFGGTTAHYAGLPLGYVCLIQ